MQFKQKVVVWTVNMCCIYLHLKCSSHTYCTTFLMLYSYFIVEHGVFFYKGEHGIRHTVMVNLFLYRIIRYYFELWSDSTNLYTRCGDTAISTRRRNKYQLLALTYCSVVATYVASARLCSYFLYRYNALKDIVP